MARRRQRAMTAVSWRDPGLKAVTGFRLKPGLRPWPLPGLQTPAHLDPQPECRLQAEVSQGLQPRLHDQERLSGFALATCTSFPPLSPRSFHLAFFSSRAGWTPPLYSLKMAFLGLEGRLPRRPQVEMEPNEKTVPCHQPITYVLALDRDWGYHPLCNQREPEQCRLARDIGNRIPRERRGS